MTGKGVIIKKRMNQMQRKSRGAEEHKERERKARSSEDSPFPESIVQKLNRGVGHGCFSLSDQPVFVLKRE